MYTRGQGNDASSQNSRRRLNDFGAAMPSDVRGGAPILIPQDYRGEFLRASQAQQMKEAPPVQTRAAEDAYQDEHMAELSDTVEEVPLPPSVMPSGEAGTLLGGLYGLLVGENGDEEETLLLLAIGLLLLWGHLDRGGLFDRSTWDSDDLALLMIGYLLLS